MIWAYLIAKGFRDLTTHFFFCITLLNPVVTDDQLSVSK